MPKKYSREILMILKDHIQSFPGTERAVNALIRQLADSDAADVITMKYVKTNFAIIPEIEKAAIELILLTEEKKLGMQLYFSPAPVIVHADQLFLQPLLSRLFSDLLHTARQNSTVKIHVTGNEGRCIIECINKGQMMIRQHSEAYFKKYRITNVSGAPTTPAEKILPAYQQLIKDMNGELLYSFSKEKDNYFRLKLPLG